jgi:predicted outer membrane repeat protein
MGLAPRRAGGIAGLSLIATTGLLGAYVAYPGLRRAYAVTPCEVTIAIGTDPGTLAGCLDGASAGFVTSITFADSLGPIILINNLPVVTLRGPLTITGNGTSSTVIDGSRVQSAFSFLGDHDVVISSLTVEDTTQALKMVGNGDVELSDTDFLRNETSGDGGAVYISGNGDLTVTDSTFTLNRAYDYGGAIWLSGNGSVAITRSTFLNNYGDEGAGAVEVSGTGALTVTDSYFSGNETSPGGDGGGALYRSGGGTTSVTSSTFADNYASNDGGAIYAAGGSSALVTVTDSTFLRNSTDDDGGAIHIGSTNPLTVRNSTFSSNVADRDGGAIFIKSTGAAAIENSTFTGNNRTVAGEGAAFYAESDSATATMNFVTISGNTTSRPSSGAVHTKGSMTVSNSIVQGNTGGDVFAVGSLTASYSLFTSSSSVSPSVSGASLIFGQDPLLGGLADNGGPTETMMPAAGSPVIGTANPVGAPATDQRGFARTTNGLADMGSVESGGVAPEPDLSQVPPSWFQATTRGEQGASCPAGREPSWAAWPNEGRGGWTCEWVTWWDVNKGTTGDWVTTPGFNVGRRPGQ